MSCGEDFVETLRKIGYPRAELLHGADFDWLFEAGGAEPFLRWFCGSVSERNVLSEEEVQAFGRLRGAGRPVLEGAALEEAVRTCAAPLARAPAAGGTEVEALERELRALQDLRSLRVRRQDQRRLLAAATRHRALQLSAAEEAAAEPLRRGRAAIRAASGEVKGTLRAAADAVDQLMRFFEAPPNAAAAGGSPPVFLYRCPSEQYLSQEERSTAALACYTRTQLFQGVHAVVESSSEEHFQLVDLRAPAVCGSPEDAQGRRLEMARLQLAFICAQHQAVHLRASNLSLKARIEWAEETLRGLATQALGKENLEAKISSLNTGILKLEEQITHIKENTLPAVIKENAQLLNMPVVKGDFDLQIAKQDYYTARQQLVLNQLIKQKASFELLQLSYEIELRKHRDIHRQLESLVQELSQSNSILHQRLEMLTELSVSQQRNPKNTIDTKDYSTHRLYQLLEGENKRKELFITHRNLEEVAEKLKQDVSLVQDQLAISAQERSFSLSKLNNDADLLCDILYQGRNQLLLSDQELTEQFHQVESQLNKLNHLLSDVLADVKTKRKILASNKLHQMERELYVYFLKDEDYLKNIVENLENKSKDFMKMENYQAFVGFDLCKIPLSSVAQKIMSAMHSGNSVESVNWRENEKTAEVVNKSSVRHSGPLHDGTNQALGEKCHSSSTSETSGAPIRLSPRPSTSRPTDPLPTEQKRKLSAPAPARCLIPPHKQEASVLQEMEHKRKYFLKKYINNENKESMDIKRKRITCNDSPEKTTKHEALEDADKVEASLNSGDSGAFGTRFCDTRYLDDLGKRQLIEVLKQAVAVVVTLMYKDGSTQLRADQALAPSVKGVAMLLQSHEEGGRGLLGASASGQALEEGFPPRDRYIYVETEHSSVWGQELEAHSQFARHLLLQILTCDCPVVCHHAKDFVRTVLQLLGGGGSWKRVAGFMGLDPSIAAWLIDPRDALLSFEDLVAKYCENSIVVKVSSTHGNSSKTTVHQNTCAKLRILYRLTMELCSQLKVYGLWQLFCTLELPLIPILAVMESHSIQVNKEDLERTSALLGASGLFQFAVTKHHAVASGVSPGLKHLLLGSARSLDGTGMELTAQLTGVASTPRCTTSSVHNSRLKELEQEAHFVAGEQFLITSNNQLREILFGKLKLHLLSPVETLPKTGPWRHLSTSEAVLNALRDLHPLPGVVLEHRQVHKIKSTFVDGLLACVKKGSVSSTWNQTGTVTGRLSSKHPICVERVAADVRKRVELPEALMLPLRGMLQMPECGVWVLHVTKLSSREKIIHVPNQPMCEVPDASISASISPRPEGPTEALPPEQVPWGESALRRRFFPASPPRPQPCLDTGTTAQNIQGISKHPIQMTKPQDYRGTEEDTLTIAPRTVFVAAEGHSFLAADFSQIELRILAHLSGDPELLKLFQEPERDDVFSALTSQWKDIPADRVTHTDRERTKKVVYSVVYGAGINSEVWKNIMNNYPEVLKTDQRPTEVAGKERLAACLGVTIQEASQFLESFLQKYKKIKDFAQATIARCRQTGYVTSIMGRRRPLPRIRSRDQQLRAQAERQAVNFVVQGSAADLCKMAMTHIFTAVAASPTLTARLVAQIHDELLFEVEDPQIAEFAALVRGAMESVQHVRTLDLQLQVPLKVSLSAGCSWGHLVPLQEAPNLWPRPRPAESPSNHQASAGPLVSTCTPHLHLPPEFCL